MRLRLGNSVLVSVPLLEPTLSWLQTLTLETTLPSSTLACTWQPSAGCRRLILQLREPFYFSQIICQASTWQSWCCRHETNPTRRCDSVGKLFPSILITSFSLLLGQDWRRK